MRNGISVGHLGFERLGGCPIAVRFGRSDGRIFSSRLQPDAHDHKIYETIDSGCDDPKRLRRKQQAEIDAERVYRSRPTQAAYRPQIPRQQKGREGLSGIRQIGSTSALVSFSEFRMIAASKNKCGKPRNPCALKTTMDQSETPESPATTTHEPGESADAMKGSAFEPTSEPPEDLEALKMRVYRRLLRQGNWTEAQPIRDQVARDARADGASKSEAHRKAYETIDAMFPDPNAGISGTNEKGVASATNGRDETTIDGRGRAIEDGAMVIGLGDLPETWPSLPPNSPLAVEIQWVQANRLRCVTENGDQAIVDLSRAMSPAPSYAALGWMETSIRAYTKFVDVAAKATASLEDEREHIRREKIAIEEVRSLLAEMLDDESRV